MIADRPRRHRVVVVQRQREVGTGEAGEEAVVQHGRCARAAFFGRLADHDQRAAPAIAVLGHQPGGAGPRRHVEIVSARVHDRRRLPGGVGRHHRAGERQSRFLRHRQRVELGAHHRGRSRAVLHHGDNARAAHAGRDVEAERLHARRQLGCRLRFLERQLRVAMEIDIQRLDVGIDGIDFRGGRCRSRRGDRLCQAHRACERQQQTDDVIPTHGGALQESTQHNRWKWFNWSVAYAWSNRSHAAFVRDGRSGRDSGANAGDARRTAARPSGRLDHGARRRRHLEPLRCHRTPDPRRADRLDAARQDHPRARRDAPVRRLRSLRAVRGVARDERWPACSTSSRRCARTTCASWRADARRTRTSTAAAGTPSLAS